MLELETDTSKGVEKVNFYSAFDLKAICIQKNGSFINPVLPQTAATVRISINITDSDPSLTLFVVV